MAGVAKSNIIIPEPARPRCIYCGGEVTKVRDGEHVIQEALGGKPTLKNVCGNCNGGFSEIDRELTSKSPVSYAAAACLRNAMANFWFIERDNPFNMIEAKPDLKMGRGTVLPQIHIESDGTYFCGPSREMANWGYETYASQLTKLARYAFFRSEAGDKGWLHPERITVEDAHLDGRRFVPRVFFTKPLEEILKTHREGKKISLRLRFRHDWELRHVYHALDNWYWRAGIQPNRPSVMWTDRTPTIFMHWEGLKLIRALMKSAVNLVHYVCGSENVQVAQGQIDMIRGQRPVPDRYMTETGFVKPCALTEIAADKDGHSFRICRRIQNFTVYSSYFGGLVCAVTPLLGQLNVSWESCDVKAPLNSKTWTINPLPRYFPFDVKPEINDIGAMLGNMGHQKVITTVTAEPIRPKKRQ
jgi:hypothetical protein